MSKKLDKFTLHDPFLDRRIKMLPCQKENVIRMFNRGASINSISRMYKVNKRLIQFIIYPERQSECLKRRQERGGTKMYYDKEKHNAATKEYRKHKKEILSLTSK